MSNMFEAAIQAAETREETEAELRRQRKEADASARLQATKSSFTNNFFRAVVNAGGKWSSSDLKKVQAYCQALVSEEDIVLPELNDNLKQVVNDKFAFGMVVGGTTIPARTFAGQRQDWFPTLFETKKTEHMNRKGGNKPATTSVLHTQSGSSSPLAAVIEMPGSNSSDTRRRRDTAS